MNNQSGELVGYCQRCATRNSSAQQNNNIVSLPGSRYCNLQASCHLALRWLPLQGPDRKTFCSRASSSSSQDPSHVGHVEPCYDFHGLLALVLVLLMLVL